MNIFLMVVLLLCFALICYTDFRWFIIPDSVNAVIFFAGLLYRTQQGWDALAMAVVFAVSVAIFMGLIRYAHLKLTGRLGLGLGDVKLAGAAAVWFSPLIFPVFLFLASALALLFLAGSNLKRKSARLEKVPFGPFLAAALIVTWNIDRLVGPLIGPVL